MLKRAFDFGAEYRRSNVDQIRGQSFDTLICAGAPAAKWIANKEPAEDAANLASLIDALKEAKARRLILISTVDVFSDPVDVDESTVPHLNGLHPYGTHRRNLEEAVMGMFECHHVIRLPGLVGEGLKKNAVFDLVTRNNIDQIDPRGSYQLYPKSRLSVDVESVVKNDLRVVHLVPPPVVIGRVACELGVTLEDKFAGKPARYDVHTKYGHLFGGDVHYTLSLTESLEGVRQYAAMHGAIK